MNAAYETIIGLEVHVELNTKTKIFCSCSTAFGAPPNTQCCPVCTGMPGALPVLNRRVVEYALRAGLATHCTVNPVSGQDRKHYFYPDLPKAYQISQYRHPLCRDGYLEIRTPRGARRVRIARIHIEEDAGKLIHDSERGTLIDMNRCGVPLIEIVTAPDLRTAAEARTFLQALRTVLLYAGITDGKMNVGVWNCVVTATDANGNYATATVRVTVKGEAKYMVTFDGANEGEYAYGEKIVKPADPTKEATEKYQYTFDGWYNGDEKWDFDHDIVTSDVALVAKFIESDVYYKVAVTVSSETQTIYVTYGAQVDLSVFDKEGFEKEVKQNGEVITKLIVTEDTAIEITYTQSASNTPSGCAGGCAGSLTGVGGIGVLLTLIGGGMLMRKKEETDEK